MGGPGLRGGDRTGIGSWAPPPALSGRGLRAGPARPAALPLPFRDFKPLGTLGSSPPAWSGFCLNQAMESALCNHLFVATHKGPSPDHIDFTTPWRHCCCGPHLLPRELGLHAALEACFVDSYQEANCCWSATRLSTERKNNRNFESNSAEEFLPAESDTKKWGLHFGCLLIFVHLFYCMLSPKYWSGAQDGRGGSLALLQR